MKGDTNFEIAMALNGTVVLADGLVADDADPFAGSETSRAYISDGAGTVADAASVPHSPVQLGRPADGGDVRGDRLSTCTCTHIIN